MAVIITTLSVGALAYLAPDAAAKGADRPERPTQSVPACMHVSAEARKRAAGYDHWVHIKNQCESPAACDISTNVSPKSLTVTIQPREAKSVITFRGSPARTFVPYVTCHLPQARRP